MRIQERACGGFVLIRLALVDDHELVREGLVALLEGDSSLGIQIVYSGKDVGEAVRAHADVALLDIDLGPDSAPVGESVAAFVSTGVRVLLISAFDDAVSVRSALKEGALGFVPKRVAMDVLREALATAAQGDLYLSVDLAAILSSATERPDLSPRELTALQLYASGLTLTAVANSMAISPHTVKEYLDRVRTKYANVGRSARTRTELYAAASRDGLLEAP